MWMVYNSQDTYTQGYSVANEHEAIDICEREKDMTYCYISMEQLVA